MKRGAFVGMIVGGVLGILAGICIVWIGLIFDDSFDGVAPLVFTGFFVAVTISAMFAAAGAVIGALVKAISN
jgi:hypothetical protein